jgi:phosphohistidine phosphatase
VDRPAPTTKRVLLLRHAKSSWKDTGLADHDRPLARRGHRAAEGMAHYLHQHRMAPALVLCSSATRATETLDHLAPALGESEVRVEPGLYHASGEELLERLREVPERTGSVLLIGHHPALFDLACELAGSGAELERLQAKFPTGALAAIELRGRWRALEPGDGRLVGFVTPRDLPT